MAKQRVQMNLKGINAVMKSDGVQQLVHEAAEDIAQRADLKAGTPGGHEVRDAPHKWVARSFVVTDSLEAAEAQRDNYSLVRAVKSS